MLEQFRDRRVVVLGLARQGVALARRLAQAGARVVVSDNQRAETLAAQVAALSTLPIEFELGGHPESLLDGADLVCLSGGVPPDLPIVQAARQRGLPLSNDSQIFLEACPAGVQVVGLTGSAGKTTTTTLVGRMLAAQAAGAGRVWVGGNIGHPLIADLDALQPGDTVVMELSSFQLELMTRSPQIAGVLNITPNHLDRHGTMAAYTEAKSHILRYQDASGVAVLGWDDPGARALRPLAKGRVAYFSAVAAVEEGAFLGGGAGHTGVKNRGQVAPGSGGESDSLKEGTLYFRWAGETQAVAALSDIHLRGRHNVLNVLAACALSGAAGATPAAMRQGLAGFTGVAHRLELVAERNGVRWYNDSIATAPERVLAALRSFDEPLVLLLGGRDKKLPWGDLAALVRERVKHVVVFGEAAGLIAQALAAGGVSIDRISRGEHLAQAVQAAARVAQPGDTVLLSPGGTSYDEFRDFEARGERYRELVRKLE